jgi:hypothetical protein
MPKKRYYDFKTFSDYVTNETNGEYSVYSNEYINCHTKIKIKHNVCGNVFSMLPTCFSGGNRCPKCADVSRQKKIKARRKSPEQFRQEVYDLVGDEYSVLEDYINSKTKVTLKHNTCGNKYQVAPYHFLGGRRCPKCAQLSRTHNLRKSPEQFRQEVYGLVGDEYSVLEDYITNRTKIKMKHNKCGNIWKVSPYHFLDGKRCPKCSRSKAEERIANYLDKHNISYESEKRFPECRDKHPLPFDFYIESMNMLIEFDGLQHYEESNFGWGAMTLKEYQEHDKIKTEFCKDNNFNLIRIPYTEYDNLEKVLDTIFK